MRRSAASEKESSTRRLTEREEIAAGDGREIASSAHDADLIHARGRAPALVLHRAQAHEERQPRGEGEQVREEDGARVTLRVGLLGVWDVASVCVSAR